MTATNKCYNFVGFGCSPPLNVYSYVESSFSIGIYKMGRMLAPYSMLLRIPSETMCLPCRREY